MRNLRFKRALLTLFLLPTTAFAIEQFANFDSGWIGGYNSFEGGVEEERSREERVYTIHQIERLRQAVSPRYIRILDWSREHEAGGFYQKGILFTVEGYEARDVRIAGDFNNWRPEPMRRNSRGVWYRILPLREVEQGKIVMSYDYKFQIDGIWRSDPKNRLRIDDGLGGYYSRLRLESIDTERTATVRTLRERQRGVAAEERLVEFAIYLPDVNNLSLVGNFNRWNPESDMMVRGEDGVFRLRLRLAPGEYYYMFVADGQWSLDRFNSESRYHSSVGDLVSWYLVE